VAVAGEDLVLVEHARLDAGHEQLEHARHAEAPHRQEPAVPAAELADDAHAARARRPHREGDAGGAVDHPRVRAELVVETPVRALAEEIQVDVPEGREEAIRIAALPLAAVGEAEAEAVVERQHDAGEETRRRARRPRARAARLRSGEAPPRRRHRDGTRG
jgi:hypothetical protein